MKIKNQFRISIVAFCIIVVIIAASIIVTEQQTAQLNNQESIIRNIETGASNLNYISNSYFLYQDNASIVLWQSQYSEMTNYLASIVVTDPQQKALIQAIKSDLDNLKIVFDGAVLFLEKSPRNLSVRSLPEFQTQWSRMAVQIQALSFDSQQLSRALDERANQLTFMSIILIVASLGLFGAYFVTNYFLQSRNTLKSISKLQDGISIIGSGDLNYSVKAGKRDEIEEISKSVNLMAANLRTVTASKSDLEMEIAERKRVEEALKESEQLYRTLFENTEDAFQLLKPLYDEAGNPRDLLLLKVNKAYERQTGLKAVDVVGKTVKEYIPDVEPDWITVYGNVAKTGKSTHIENYNQSTNRWYDVYAFLYGKDQVGALFRDITERKKAEEALEESEERYHSLFSSIGEGFGLHEMLFDSQGVPNDYRFLEANTGFERQTGLRASEILGKTVCECCPDLEPFWIETYGKVVVTGEPVRFGTYTRSLKRYFEVYAFRPVEGRFATIFTDITERKKAEDTLKEAEEKFKNMIEQSPDVFGLYDENCFLIQVNKAWENLWEVPRELAIGKWNPLKSKQVSDIGWVPLIKKAYAGETMDAPETEFDPSLEPLTMGKGRKRWIKSIIYPLKNIQGKVQNIVMMHQDTTERKLLERQLQDNERMAAIGQTAGMIGHDIRNPLQAIISELYLAKEVIAQAPESKDKQESLESMNFVEEQVNYINKIVSDLQDFARPLNPEYVIVDLPDLLVSVFDAIVLPDKIKLKVDVKGTLKLKTDSTFMRRAITNLVNNAVQAMPEGGELALTARKQEECVVITVSDTGQGIPEHVKGNLV